MSWFPAEGLQFLDNEKIYSIKTNRSLITLHPNDTVRQAFETLANQLITSAPVYNPQSNQFLGFVDVLDLTVFIVRVFAETYAKHPHLYDPKEIAQRFEMPVRDVINASSRDPFLPVDASESLSFLIDNFLKFGVHRVPTREGDVITGIVSQSDIAKYLYRNKDKFGSMLQRRISDLGMLDKFKDGQGIISITNDQPLMRAFTTILIHKVSGLPVVDLKTGELINNISASDLKGITQSTFFKLETPIHQLFLNQSTKLPSVTVTPDTTLEELMRGFEGTGVHRVFVIDSERRPIGVITLTDLLKQFSTKL